MKNTIKAIFWVILISVAFYALIVAISAGISKEEVVTCLKYQKQAKEYPSFYITFAEKQMCDTHQILINSEVK